jgi:hypothetical protein
MDRNQLIDLTRRAVQPAPDKTTHLAPADFAGFLQVPLDTASSNENRGL